MVQDYGISRVGTANVVLGAGPGAALGLALVFRVLATTNPGKTKLEEKRARGMARLVRSHKDVCQGFFSSTRVILAGDPNRTNI